MDRIGDGDKSRRYVVENIIPFRQQHGRDCGFDRIFVSMCNY